MYTILLDYKLWEINIYANNNESTINKRMRYDLTIDASKFVFFLTVERVKLTRRLKRLP